MGWALMPSLFRSCYGGRSDAYSNTETSPTRSSGSSNKKKRRRRRKKASKERGAQKNQTFQTSPKLRGSKASTTTTVHVKARKDVGGILPAALAESTLRTTHFLYEHKAGVVYINDYVLLSHIDRGSNSTVKLGLNLNKATLEAVKITSAEAFKKRKQSVSDFNKFLQGLQHPNVVLTNEVSSDNNGKFVITFMEYQEGGSLMKEELKTWKAFSFRKARKYFAQIVMGLTYLHSKNLIHGDLTLQNILVSGQVVKIADLDSCKSIFEKQSFRTTPAYCAPELIRHTSGKPTGTKSKTKATQSGNYSFKSDMWALGVCLYTMLHGFLPFQSANKYLLFNEILDRKISIRKDVPEELRFLLEGLLQRDPKKRFSLKQMLVNAWVRKELVKNAVMDSFYTDPLRNNIAVALGKGASLSSYRKGDYLCRKGQIGNSVFFILEGQVEVLYHRKKSSKEENENREVRDVKDHQEQQRQLEQEDKITGTGVEVEKTADDDIRSTRESFPCANEYYGIKPQDKEDVEDRDSQSSLTMNVMSDTLYDLEYGPGSHSFTKHAEATTRDMISKVVHDGDLRGKGEVVGEVCATRSLRKKSQGFSRRIASCRACCHVEALEVPVQKLDTQCILHLHKIALETVKQNKLYDTSKELETLYNNYEENKEKLRSMTYDMP